MTNQLIGYEKNGNTCGNMDWYAATPIESVENDMENFVLYPNPAYDCFYISNEKAIGELYELYDIHGRLLQRNIYTQEGINVSEYPAGIYFCRIGGEGRRLVKAN